MGDKLDFIRDSGIFIDLYDILGVEIDANPQKIKSSYIKMAKKHHPDQGGSGEKFLDITRAYEILYNKETRKEYDLYYLNNNKDEFVPNEILRLKNDFNDFIQTNHRPLTKEEIYKIYENIFVEQDIKSMKIDEFINRIVDIDIERKNTQIETLDDTLKNFMEKNSDVKLEEVFEYINSKNSNAFSKDIILKDLGTLDTLPGYSNGFSSFIDDNNFGSNIYSDIGVDIGLDDSINNLNINEFTSWKKTKHTDTKLTDNDIEKYLAIRQEEQKQIYSQVETDLSNCSKKKQVEKFLHTKNLLEDIENYTGNEIYNNQEYKYCEYLEPSNKSNLSLDKKNNKIPEIIEIDNVNPNKIDKLKNSNNIDDMLEFMKHVKNKNTENYDELEKELDINENIINTNKDSFEILKSQINIPKNNNVRKR